MGNNSASAYCEWAGECTSSLLALCEDKRSRQFVGAVRGRIIDTLLTLRQRGRRRMWQFVNAVLGQENGHFVSAVCGQESRPFVSAACVQENRQFVRTVSRQRNFAVTWVCCQHSTVCGQESKEACDRCVSSGE